MLLAIAGTPVSAEFGGGGAQSCAAVPLLLLLIFVASFSGAALAVCFASEVRSVLCSAAATDTVADPVVVALFVLAQIVFSACELSWTAAGAINSIILGAANQALIRSAPERIRAVFFLIAAATNPAGGGAAQNALSAVSDA